MATAFHANTLITQLTQRCLNLQEELDGERRDRRYYQDELEHMIQIDRSQMRMKQVHAQMIDAFDNSLDCFDTHPNLIDNFTKSDIITNDIFVRDDDENDTNLIRDYLFLKPSAITKLEF